LDQKADAAVIGQTEGSKSKKSDKPPRNFLGVKKGK
jgi:hypothetical protein